MNTSLCPICLLPVLFKSNCSHFHKIKSFFYEDEDSFSLTLETNVYVFCVGFNVHKSGYYLIWSDSYVYSQNNLYDCPPFKSCQSLEIINKFLNLKLFL